MPQVPVYDTPQVMGQNLPDFRQQTPQKLMQKADIGPGEQIRAGQAAGQFAGTLANENTMDQIALNENRAKEYDAQLNGAYQAVLNGSNDGQTPGYLALKGKDAVDAKQSTIDKINALPSQLATQFDNPAQQQLAAHTAAIRKAMALTQVNQHATQQLGVYTDSVNQTRMRVDSDAAAGAYDPSTDRATPSFNQDDPTANTPYQVHLQAAQSAAAAYAASHGLDPNAAAAQAAQGVYLGTMQHLLGQQGPTATALAQAYYDQVKDALATAQRDKIEPLLHAATTSSDALTLSIALGQKFDPTDTAGKIEELKYRFSSGEISAEVYHAALANVHADQAQYHQQVEQQQVTLISQISRLQERNPNLTISQLPNDIHAALQAPENGRLYEQMVKLLAPQPPGGRVTDPDLKFDLINNFGTGRPGDALTMSNAQFLALRGSMSQADFDEFTRQRARGTQQQAAARADAGTVDLRRVRDTLNSRLSEININPSPPVANTDARARLADVHSFVQDYVRSQQVSAGHRFTDDEAEKAIDKLFATNVEFRNKFAGFIPAGTSTAPLMGLQFNDLPSSAVTGLRNALIKNGNPNPTNADILNLYRRQHLD